MRVYVRKFTLDDRRWFDSAGCLTSFLFFSRLSLSFVFRQVSDQLEKGAKPAEVSKQLLQDHWKVIFNGNGYDASWPDEAGKRGVWRIDSGVEAMQALSSEKNLALFEKMNVLSNKEAEARTEVMLDHYAGRYHSHLHAEKSKMRRLNSSRIHVCGLDND